MKAKTLAQNLGLAAAVSLLFLGALELLARSFDVPAPAAAPVADYIWDWRDNMEGDFYVIHSEAVGWPPWEEINADGLRDRTHPVEKPPGRQRLVALGDSVTLGAGIKPAEAYPRQLEGRLRSEGRLWDVMNVGLWGWSTRQERLAYERIARRYRPDHVLLGVCLNDLPELQNNLARPPEWLAALFRGSALVRRVVNAPGREIQNVEQLFTDREAPRVREAYRRFFDEVAALRAEVQKDGAAFSLTVFPFRFQVVAGAPEPVAQQMIQDYCRKEGIPFLDLLPALQPLGESGFVDYDHLSAAGAVRVAEAIAESALLPPVPNQREVLTARFPGKAADWITALGDADEPVRLAGAWAAEQAAKGRQLVAQGRELLAQDREVAAQDKEAAAGVLREAASGGQATVAALRRALADASPAVRSAAARALGAEGKAAAASSAELFERLSDDVQDVRWQSALALSRMGLRAPSAVEPLAQALRSDDAYVRGFAAWSLGNLGPAAAAAVPALVETLAKDDGYGRGGAASALARMGPAAAAAVPALLEGLRSPDGDRRWKAARTLGRIGTAAAEAMPALTEALGDPNEHVRRHAARALGRIGPFDKPAAAALQRATGDPNDEVRKEAKEALAGKDR